MRRCIYPPTATYYVGECFFFKLTNQIRSFITASNKTEQAFTTFPAPTDWKPFQKTSPGSKNLELRGENFPESPFNNQRNESAF